MAVGVRLERVTVSSRWIRRGGLAALVGGLLTVAWALWLVSLSVGVSGGTPRSVGGPVALAFLTVPLVTAGLVALAARHADATETDATLRDAGLVATAVGAVSLGLGSGVANAVAGGTLYVASVVLGVAGLVVGSALLGVLTHRAARLPERLGVFLVAGAVLLLAVDLANWRAVLAVPYGLAWVAVGAALWQGLEASGEELEDLADPIADAEVTVEAPEADGEVTAADD